MSSLDPIQRESRRKILIARLYRKKAKPTFAGCACESSRRIVWSQLAGAILRSRSAQAFFKQRKGQARCNCTVQDVLGYNDEVPNRAGVVQWQYRSFPSFGRGCDSHRPLQKICRFIHTSVRTEVRSISIALVPATSGGSRSLTPSSYDESVWQQEAGPTVFTPFADTKPREQKCSPPIILLWTIAETRTCGDIPWELRPSLA